MAQFESHKAAIKAAGAQVVYIAAQRRGGVFAPEGYFAEHAISCPFLLDEDRAVTKAYGVYHWLALDAINIARPATFVVDSKGIVRMIYVGESQSDRAPLEQVLAAVKACKPARRSRAMRSAQSKKRAVG